MVLPAYSELEKRSNERFAQASIIATSIYTTAFLAVGICGLLLFGSELDADFLLNLATRDGAVSVFCRSSFCFVLMFHVPYYFFLVKEYLLVIYDEIDSRAMSTKLEQKLADFYKNQGVKAEGGKQRKNRDQPNNGEEPENLSTGE